jgi:hypothetical protein
MSTFKPRRYIVPNAPGRVEPATLPFECDVPAHLMATQGGDFLIMQPGETRLFKGRVMHPLSGLCGLCETSGLREAVQFDFDSRWHNPADKTIAVRVTLDKKAAPARVQPALYILAADSLPAEPCIVTDEMPRPSITPYRREWRTILPLTRSDSDEPEPRLRETLAVAQPNLTFRGRQLILEPTGLPPEIQVTLLQVNNVAFWNGPVPAGVFIRDDEHGYEPPWLDLDVMNVAQRLQMRFASLGRGAHVKAGVHGLYALEEEF